MALQTFAKGIGGLDLDWKCITLEMKYHVTVILVLPRIDARCV